MPLAKLTTARQIALMRAHVALIVVFTRRRVNVAVYIQKLFEQLAAIVHHQHHHQQDDGQSAIMRFLADGFVEIFGASTTNDASAAGENGEHLLFDAWLPRYLASCSMGEQERILRCSNAMLQRAAAVRFALNADETRRQSAVLQTLYATMLPYVLQAFVKANASRLIAELAANLCLGCTFAGSVYSFEEVFEQFTDACVSNMQ